MVLNKMIELHKLGTVCLKSKAAVIVVGVVA